MQNETVQNERAQGEKIQQSSVQVQPIVDITDRAAAHIQMIIVKGQQDNRLCSGLRIGIKKGGCSGSEYDFQYAESKATGEMEISQKGVKLYIDPQAVPKLIGSQMDYVSEKFSSGFVFTNPNEKGVCGCGKSVQL